MKLGKDVLAWKLIAVLAALAYLYKVSKATGEPMHGKYRPEQVANLAAQLLPKEYRPQARQLGAVMLNRVFGG